MKHSTIFYSPLAVKHLEDIAVYTEETWGIRQRIKYMQEMMDRIESLVEYPQRAK
jgi:plasmid stabilization system protein ParE